jgi:hypothetical protein
MAEDRRLSARTVRKFMKLFRFLPGRGSAGSWRHQDDTGTVAPRKPTSSWAPADRKALARSRLLNGKDLSRTSAAPRPRNDQSVRFNLPQPDVSTIRAPPQSRSRTLAARRARTCLRGNVHDSERIKMLYGSVRPGEDDRLTGGACQLTGLPDPDIQVLGRPVRVSWSARHHEPHRHHPTGPRPGRGHSAVDPARPLKR